MERNVRGAAACHLKMRENRMLPYRVLHPTELVLPFIITSSVSSWLISFLYDTCRITRSRSVHAWLQYEELRAVPLL